MTSATATPLPQPIPTQELQTAPRSWVGRVLLDTVGQTGAKVGLVWIAVVAFCAVFAPFIASSHPYLIKIDGQVTSPLLRHLTGPDVLLLLLAATVVVVTPFRRLSTGQKAAIVFWMLLGAALLVWWKPFAGWLSLLRRTWAGMDGHGWPILWLSLSGVAVLADLFLLGLILFRLGISNAAKLVMVGAMVLFAVVAILWPIDPPTNVVYSQYREAAAEGRVEWVVNAPIPYSPSDRLRDQFSLDRPHPWPPTRGHLMGTEVNGADILSNMIHACRIAMSIGFISTGIALIIGTIVGGLMGYFVGLVDLLGMRLVEVFAAIPTLYLLLAFVAYFDRNIYMIMAIIGLTSWVGDARFVRAEFLKLRNQDFVQAALAAGLPLRSVLFRHLLPNAMAPLLVSASFGVASAIVAESTLSFLGLGLVDEASWGRLLDMARGAGGGFNWWLALFPGLAIFLTVLAYNLIGESFRDALDPRLKGSH